MHVAYGPVCPKQITKRVESNMLASKSLCQSELHMPQKLLPHCSYKDSMHPRNLWPTIGAKSWPLRNATPILCFMRLNIFEKFSGACILAYFLSGRKPCLHALMYARG